MKFIDKQTFQIVLLLIILIILIILLLKGNNEKFFDKVDPEQCQKEADCHNTLDNMKTDCPNKIIDKFCDEHYQQS